MFMGFVIKDIVMMLKKVCEGVSNYLLSAKVSNLQKALFDRRGSVFILSDKAET